jgi:TPR repeat protein
MRNALREHQAIRSLQALAEKGDVFAQLTLAHHYLHGDGVRQDYRLAAKWFDQAERRGDVWEPSSTRRVLAKQMTQAQIAEAERWAQEWVAIFKLLPRD